ncbi:Stp1/IreP family PP2C-type Ser/Thr phosphatase [Clostridium sp. SM-530-WT-3G]|uniref:Stp1/IreP family PP2C-type Ser/Thr phosphatase n=1 Tax=Clostridium sp. SM-530-WT-3G TaxID=2725303 RepID=UPI00145DA8C8|nr:Stp1/IreP family PP2C-type Ser/Thr phosphatase [Clostridium sp. SM-530-WT-3G]NME81729.1 Stp1/IreP family PP2C-type Ser/Thr phosphatase [Clostridium sp. SM-530-WT-3G]
MVGLVSDIGLKRALNEDYAAYYEDADFKIYVVADGMGGHNAGEVASKMAAERIVDYVKYNFSKIHERELIKIAIEEANREIFNFSMTSDKLNGMGTTVTACLITRKNIYVANVGDSSCIGIKDGMIKKITKDHSLVQELIDSGTISEMEAVNHPKKNIITRALGTNQNVCIDVFDVMNGEYEVLLLCSDGLTNELTKEEILQIVMSEKNYDHIANKLVDMAKEKGGRDNITVLLFGGEM